MEQREFIPQPASRSRKSEGLIFVLFLCSLPFVNPWIRGDGVGYYAFARAPLIEHNLDFSRDYQNANESFRDAHVDESGQPKSTFRTPTGYLDNHFTVGPAILWTPFLLLAHGGVLLARALGSSVAADGFSVPYRIAMAFTTALYGFLGLLFSLNLARQYVEERWAFLATCSIWGASSLAVYMYFNPSWSHAHSAFAVALFLWYWHKTRGARSRWEWLILALIAGLMLNVYYANAMVLFVLVAEGLSQYLLALRRDSQSAAENLRVSNLLISHLLFAFTLLVCLLPTFLTRYIIYGNAFESGYPSLRSWPWFSPALLSVLLSSNHGLLSWTPILLFSILGLFIFRHRVPPVGGPLLAAFLAFYVFIACCPFWDGVSSYGSRYFVSLTPLFIFGLAVFLDRIAAFFHSRRAALAAACAFLALFVLWNAGLMFQWGSHLVPARGPISFSEMIHNQFFVVPRQLTAKLHSYLFKRKELMKQIEEGDVEQLKKYKPTN